MLKPLVMIVFKTSMEDFERTDRLCGRLEERYLTPFKAKGFVPAIQAMHPDFYSIIERFLDQGDLEQVEHLLLANTCEEEGPFRDHPEWFRMTRERLDDPDAGPIYLFQWLPAPIHGGRRRRPLKGLEEVLGKEDSLTHITVREPGSDPHAN